MIAALASSCTIAMGLLSSLTHRNKTYVTGSTLPRVVSTLGKITFDPTWKSAFGTVLNQTAPYGTCRDLVDNVSTFKEQPYDLRSQYDWFQLQLPVMAIFLDTYVVFWDRQDYLHELRVHAGTESSKSGRIGRTGQHTSHNAP